MDQEIVVKDPLTKEMIDAGVSLVIALDAQGWPVTAAFWFFLPQSGRWRLVIASPEVGKKGPKEAYGHIRRAIAQMPPGSAGLAFGDVTVVDPSEEPVTLLRPLLGTTSAQGISGMRVVGAGIQGRYIEDAYVYRLT